MGPSGSILGGLGNKETQVLNENQVLPDDSQAQPLDPLSSLGM